LIKVTIPATSANVGAGFDSLGLALNLYNTVWVAESDTVDIRSVDQTTIPETEDNLVYTSAKTVYDICGKPLPGLKIRQRNNIPIARGLGSSSACVVGGLLAANALLGEPMSREDIITLAADIEGHPDNIAPALLGGFVVAVVENRKVYSVRAKIPESVSFLACIPNFELKTAVARGALPMEVAHKDAVFNVSRAALLSVSLLTGNLKNLRVAVDDRLHQPYRLKYIPHASEIMEGLSAAGSLGTFISGAGPTLLSMAPSDDHRTIDRMTRFMQENYPNWNPILLRPDEKGARYESVEEADIPSD
jgi:homoserine kinase